MTNVLTAADLEPIADDRRRLRGKIQEIADEKLRQWFLAYHGFRNSQLGHRRKVSRRMTPAMVRRVRSYPDEITDREIVQHHNLAIGDVSNVRRGTRR